MIGPFKDKYEFLSNFYYHHFVWAGKRWVTAEHAFQAAKTSVHAEQNAIQLASTPTQAKRLGRKATLRSDWEETKIDYMISILRKKFECETMKAKLLDTGEESLVEVNWWGDKFWGVCEGKGQNYLGKVLMGIREELKK